MKLNDSSSKRGASLRSALRLCRPHFLAAAAFSALINLLYLTPTIYMLQAYDRAIPSGGGATLLLLSVVALAALGVLSFLDWIRSRLLVRAGGRIEREVAGPVMTAILARSTMSRIQRLQAMRDFDIVRQTLSGAGSLAVLDAPWAPIYILAAFALNPVLGAICLGATLLLIVLAWMNERATHPPLKEAGLAASTAYARQDHASAFSAEIRALGMGSALVEKQLVERARMIELQTRASFAAAGFGGIIKFVRLALQSAALGAAAWLAIGGHLAPGAVVAASFLLSRALSPIEQIVGAWRSIGTARDAWSRLSGLLNVEGRTAYTALPAPRGNISFEGATVVSPTSDRLSLANVTLQIMAGEMIGVVGPSGAGKSTLLRATAGAAELARGVIRIDGAARGDWDPEMLARHIGYLPQDFLLFHGTVKENISRFQGALPGASGAAVDAAAIAAAQACGAHDLILRLPRGYDTPVGLGGEGLSAGQTQRIALARALYGSPEILILDEPNAHLDAEGEAMLCEHLAREKARGVTILASAHHGAVLNNADKLLHIRAGQVTDFASLAEVAKRMRAAADAPAASRAPAQVTPKAPSQIDRAVNR